jgi:hypothetical protein
MSFLDLDGFFACKIGGTCESSSYPPFRFVFLVEWVTLHVHSFTAACFKKLKSDINDILSAERAKPRSDSERVATVAVGFGINETR